MSDIVERLRERPWRHGNETEIGAKERRQREREEGAEEITRLRLDLRDAYTEADFQKDKVASHGESIVRLRAENEQLLVVVKRLLLEFDFMVESKIIPDVRDDTIFVKARATITKVEESKE